MGGCFNNKIWCGYPQNPSHKECLGMTVSAVTCGCYRDSHPVSGGLLIKQVMVTR